MSRLTDRFIKYVKIDTQSWEPSDTFPSTLKQKDLAKLLAEELKAMGASDVVYDDEVCYVYATVPSTLGEDANVPVIGFVAHMDTSMAVSGKDVKPRFVENYDGKDILLNEEEGIVLKTSENPELQDYAGQTLIVTDGTTLLGADDKAGVAEIMEMAEYLLSHPEIPHERSVLLLRPMRKWAAAWIALMWKASVQIMHIPWTAAHSVNWNMKTSMLPAQNCM